MMKRIIATDGHELDCWIEPASGTPHGGIVLVQEIFGVTDQLKGVAKRYADLGYQVAIPALFDRQKPGTVVPFDQAPIGRDLMVSADLDKTMLDIDAAVTKLGTNVGKVAVIGFCWGGGLALRAAQVLDIACAVSFYGTRLPTYLDKPLKAPLQGHFGTQDDHAPQAVLDEAKAYLPSFEIFTYEGAGHAFANDARPSYLAAATNQANARTEAFLKAHIG